MPPKDSGKRGIQPKTPLPEGAVPPYLASFVKIGDRVRITPRPYSGDEVEQYRDAIGVVFYVTPRPEHDKTLIGVKINDQAVRLAFFLEEVELMPAPPMVTISLEVAHALYQSHGHSRAAFGDLATFDHEKWEWVADAITTAINIAESKADLANGG